MSKDVEQVLYNTKNFTESLIASMKDGFSVLDNRGIHIDVNAAFCRMTGFSREELIGVGHPHPYWPPEGYKDIEKAFQRTLQGDFADFELSFMHKNGKRFPVIVSPSWIKDEQGKVISYYATVKDIAERKKTEKNLKEYAIKLEEQKIALEQKNLAFKELIEHMERTKNRTKEDISINVTEIILPILKKLRLKGASQKYVKLLRHHLEELTFSFGRKITERSNRLSPREIEICNMIKGGLTSKEASELLNISYKTIDKHRRDIRKKLHISKKRINLTSFLRKL